MIARELRRAARAPCGRSLVIALVLTACGAESASPEPSAPGLAGPVHRGTLVREGRSAIPFEFRLPEEGGLVAVDIPAPEGEPNGLFTLAAAESQRLYEGEWGIMVADVTGATPHKSSLERAWPPPIAADAAGFLPGLRQAADIPVRDIGGTELGGLPAFTAEVGPVVEDRVTWGHIDVRMAGGGVTGSISFNDPSRLIVADAGDSIVLVQIWARTEAELAGWLPLALEIVDSMRFPGGP